jgi:hypothetical protein
MVDDFFMDGAKYKKYSLRHKNRIDFTKSTESTNTTILRHVSLYQSYIVGWTKIKDYAESTRKLVQEVQIMSGCFHTPELLVESTVISISRTKRLVQ